MGEAVLMDLEEVIRTKPKNMETSDSELQLIQSLKSRVLYSFIGASLASSTAVWFATKGMSPGYRFNLSFGSAIVSGIWSLRRSIDSSLEKILEQGTWSQMEMAQVLLERNYLNESAKNIFKKYFYPEEVYNDSNPDKSFIRWRRRNIYLEGASIHDNNDIKDATVSQKPNSPQATAQMRQSTSSTVVGEMLADPLDCMFGQGDAKEASRFDDSVPTKKQLRAHRRAYRRHRIHRGEHKNSDDDLKVRI
nr:hypothetical protein RF25191 [Allium cepa]UPW27172.1 hypothetical protein RF25191 [Allium cepa]